MTDRASADFELLVELEDFGRVRTDRLQEGLSVYNDPKTHKGQVTNVKPGPYSRGRCVFIHTCHKHNSSDR